MFNYTFLLHLLLLCLLFYFWWKKPHPKFPPGPRGLPIVGILPFVKGNLHSKIKEWSDRWYTPIMSARLGREDVVFLNDTNSIYKVFVKHSLSSSGRPLEGFFNEVDGNYGITSKNYSEEFKIQKNFGFKSLKGNLFGGKSMYEAVNEEANLFMEFLKTKVGTPMNLDVNIPHSLVEREKSNQQDRILLLCVFFNAFRHFPPFSTACKKYMKMQQDVYDAFVQIIEDHQSHFNPDHPKDFIDEFLHQQGQEQTKENNSFTLKQLIMYCRSLFIAGTETTAATLSWGILSLLHNPHLDEDMAKEIFACFGNNDVSASMKWEMPHLNSFMNEVLRYRPSGPFSVPHKTTETIEVDGYVIPKNTTVFSNIFAAHHDATTWSDPEVFRPSRFLRDDGSFDHRKKISSFGIGPRFCIGEQLARFELLVAFSKLFRSFVISAPDDQSLPSLDESYTTLFYSPKPFKVVLCKRE